MRVMNSAHVLDETARSLGSEGGDAALLRAALRRGAFVLSPTSRADLVTYVSTPLAALMDNARVEVEAALDDLTTYGDVLEMRRLDADPWSTQTMILRPAPPSFVRRASDAFVILGVAGEHPSALTPDLATRLDDSGLVRRLTPLPEEDLAARLSSLGFVALAETAWLGLPDARTAHAHLNEWRRRLEAARPPGPDFIDFEILDRDCAPTFYKGRWTAPAGRHEGLYVARRAQLYGPPVWCLVLLKAGLAIRLLDLQAQGDRQRPCDLAWRLQAAIDAVAQAPQRFRVTIEDSRVALEVFSPLPAFAERRLALVGDKYLAQGCLFGFHLPSAHADLEIDTLQTLLWMTPLSESSAP